ncbi:trichohyalin isoform X2 [Periophthalmus magnuspinnatus]|uniref:trichohyalin isoform X2 n=1 Tax=Periophthalmus magnuspinnatus TaxID=409849 RepID=UPI0024373232|nr:trichohyalin isoform X2 [Periophthalmus magnuspinnatus]
MDPEKIPVEGASPPGIRPEQVQDDLVQQLRDCQAKLQSATDELQSLRMQQASEMEEVESYVAHIRGLLEERESLTADYERDNEQLRLELHHIRQQQEVESKELAEMLAQKDLGEIGLSTPSELVAYLLVERATLLERLEETERRLEGHSVGNEYREMHLQEMEHLRQSVGEGLWMQKEEMQKTMENMAKCPTQSPWKKLFGLRRSGQSKYNLTPARIEEITQERIERQKLERDLEEASQRLAMAHQDIRRLTNELDTAKNNNPESSGCELEGAVQEVEHLKKEVDKLKSNDMMKLQKAKDQNDKLDSENQALRDRVHALEAEKRNLMEKISMNSNPDVSSKEEEQGFDEQIVNKSALFTSDSDPIHKRCHAAMEDGLVQLKDLQRQLQRQRKEKEELEERNEELEALLGETQNSSREERHRHEGEVEGLHRRIKSLEVELRKHEAQEHPLKNGEEVKTESYLQLHLRDSSQERLAMLEARLTEEKDWRKQLEVDLNAAQTALKKDKEALQAAERELKKLKMEVNSLQTECQQGKTLIKSLTQVKGEKAILEEKMAQLERAHSRLQTELEQVKECEKTKEAQRETSIQMEHLQQQANRLRGEVDSLQSAYNKLRDEMALERQQTSELQDKLSISVQEKISSEGEKERLQLEVQHLNEQLKLHKEQLESCKEALTSPSQRVLPEESVSPVRSTREESSDQIFHLKLELSQVQAKLDRERELSSQHQLALQAQLGEAQAHVKSQDSVLNQRAEEARQMKQDLQRAQSLFTSAERELRYEKEKNMDIKKHNTLLEQEKLKLCAELKQLQTKLIHTEQSVQSQVSEYSRQQNKIRELELELARSTSNRSATTSLQEELQAERVRLITADKKVVELQQQLKAAQHMLRLEEARAGENSRLERDSRDLSDALSALRAQQHEEHITRKLLEQREEELQQQVKALRLKEASLNRTNSELGLRSQQLDTRLVLLESELSKAREEEKKYQKSTLKLQDELASSHSECERLQSELQQVLLQLDSYVRKYNEKQSQHKTKLRQAKQVYLKATAQRDRLIQKLENDLLLASSLCHKEKERTDTVMQENEKLLEERRELLQRINEAEDMGSKGMRIASTIEHKVNVLEAENRQLQERSLKLSNQVCSLERALRNVHSLYSLEKKQPQDGLNELHTSSVSFSSAPREKLDILDALCRVKVDGTRLSSHSFMEQSYLNLTSPMAPPPDAKDPEDGPPNQDKT